MTARNTLSAVVMIRRYCYSCSLARLPCNHSYVQPWQIRVTQLMTGRLVKVLSGHTGAVHRFGGVWGFKLSCAALAVNFSGQFWRHAGACILCHIRITYKSKYNIGSVCLNSDGNLVISGSSGHADGSVRFLSLIASNNYVYYDPIIFV